MQKPFTYKNNKLVAGLCITEKWFRCEKCAWIYSVDPEYVCRLKNETICFKCKLEVKA